MNIFEMKLPNPGIILKKKFEVKTNVKDTAT